MIAKMSKYAFVLYAAQSDDFIGRLRELGLVDITTTGWEPSEEDRQLMLDIEGCARAAEFLKTFRADAGRFDAQAAPFASGEEAYARYAAAQREAAALQAEIGRLEKAAEELRPWGAFDPARVGALAADGVVLRYFSTQRNLFDKNAAGWSAQYALAEIGRSDATVWFVVVAAPGEEIPLDAQEMKAPGMDIREAERRIAEARAGLARFDAEFSRVAVSERLLAGYAASLRERLQGARVKATAHAEAEGRLVVMEGWAEKETSDRVDALLEAYPGVVYLKGDPEPGDDTPVKLKNNRFARVFELVGDMYARPKYGTMDLTPFFAPFYMLFFGINMKEWFPGIPFFDFQGRFFSIALAIGMVQILFGMLLKVVMISSTAGFRHSLASLGWLLVLLGASVAGGLPMLDPAWTIPFYTPSSPAFYATLGAGAVLMLFFNSPGRNPFVNFGLGLWDTYNNLTGILSDVLSYIRLFAIGLSGGILATVFNALADGFVPEGANIVVRLLVMVPILLVGHGINLFMSTISSFVHPMRLTFVEFYKNAGFEMSMRSFEPLRKMDDSENQ